MKRILLSLATALITVLGMSAQNTYNMVIEMNDGTKINIGPNDIKNMSFMDGNLTVDGESIDDIKKAIAELKKKVDEQKSCECSKEIEALKQEIANLNSSGIMDVINVLQMQIKSLTDEVAALKNGGSNNSHEDSNKDNQGGNDSGQIDNALVGVWHCVVYETNSYYTMGWKFDADGNCYYDEWGNSRNEGEWDVPGSWSISNDQLFITWTDEEGSDIETYSYSLSNNNTTLILTQISKNGYTKTYEFTRQ